MRRRAWSDSPKPAECAGERRGVGPWTIFHIRTGRRRVRRPRRVDRVSKHMVTHARTVLRTLTRVRSPHGAQSECAASRDADDAEFADGCLPGPGGGRGRGTVEGDAHGSGWAGERSWFRTEIGDLGRGCPSSHGEQSEPPCDERATKFVWLGVNQLRTPRPSPGAACVPIQP